MNRINIDKRRERKARSSTCSVISDFDDSKSQDFNIKLNLSGISANMSINNNNNNLLGFDLNPANMNGNQHSHNTSFTSNADDDEDSDSEESVLNNFTEESRRRLDKINSLFLSKRTLTNDDPANKINKKLAKNIKHLRVIKKKPLLTLSLADECSNTTMFDKYDVHRLKNSALLNLEASIGFIQPINEELYMKEMFPVTEKGNTTFHSTAKFCYESLAEYVVLGNFCGDVMVHHVESKLPLRIYRGKKPIISPITTIESQNVTMYAGCSHGLVRIFDVRMKSLVRVISDQMMLHNDGAENGPVHLNPTMNIEIRDDKLLHCTRSSVSVYDMRNDLKALTRVVPEDYGRGPLAFERAVLLPGYPSQLMSLYREDRSLKVWDCIEEKVNQECMTRGLILDFKRNDFLNETVLLMNDPNGVEQTLEIWKSGKRHNLMEFDSIQLDSKVKYRKLMINDLGESMYTFGMSDLAHWNLYNKEETHRIKDQLSQLICIG